MSCFIRYGYNLFGIISKITGVIKLNILLSISTILNYQIYYNN